MVRESFVSFPFFSIPTRRRIANSPIQADTQFVPALSPLLPFPAAEYRPRRLPNPVNLNARSSGVGQTEPRYSSLKKINRLGHPVFIGAKRLQPLGTSIALMLFAHECVRHFSKWNRKYEQP